jgi:hypothetical protein
VCDCLRFLGNRRGSYRSISRTSRETNGSFSAAAPVTLKSTTVIWIYCSCHQPLRPALSRGLYCTPGIQAGLLFCYVQVMDLTACSLLLTWGMRTKGNTTIHDLFSSICIHPGSYCNSCLGWQTRFRAGKGKKVSP